MDNRKMKQFFIVTLIIGVLSFVLLFIGIRGLLNHAVSWQNVFAFAVLSLLFGSLSGTFYSLRMMAALFLFLAGLIIGFFMMYLQFLSDSNGWGDLTGLMSLLFTATIGLVAGLLVQVLWYLIKRLKTKDS